MLTSLRIKNLALVEDLTLELKPGYNAITGETGAGKSILIGALNLVLGERADRTLIRTGADACTVEAVFEISGIKRKLQPFLEENGLEPCDGGNLFLKRSFTAAGTNRQFVNGSPATVAVLARIGEWLVDIHGPHEHQSLLNPVHQLAILDAFGQLSGQRDAFASLVTKRRDLEAQKASLVVDERTYAQQLDLLRFQVAEITAARLVPDEAEEVEMEYKRASNSARLIELSGSAMNLISESEPSLLSQVAAVGRTVHELNRLDPGASQIAALLEQLVSNLKELQSELDHYRDKIDVEPTRLKELEERMDLLHSLRRKYGATIPAVIQFGVEAARKLESLEQRDVELERINSELKKVESEIWASGKNLSASRKKLLAGLSAGARKQLSDLGFKQARFEVALTSQEKTDGEGRSECFSSTGLDTIEFLFAPNPGEPAHPLRAIASSGELARVMLALKTVLADQDEIPVLVFDEVDANVGGETSQAVGQKMCQIARRRQVLCITHSPHVAASAGTHFVVNKSVREGRTLSEVKEVAGQERSAEIARMLGGQTSAARKHADALLKRTADDGK